VCIVGASGKLGRYMVRHALDRGDEVVGVCREQSVAKLGAFERRSRMPTTGSEAGEADAEASSV
jgi:putative NADH-flavin reductase